MTRHQSESSSTISFDTQRRLSLDNPYKTVAKSFPDEGTIIVFICYDSPLANSAILYISTMKVR